MAEGETWTASTNKADPRRRAGQAAGLLRWQGGFLAVKMTAYEVLFSEVPAERRVYPSVARAFRSILGVVGSIIELKWG